MRIWLAPLLFPMLLALPAVGQERMHSRIEQFQPLPFHVMAARVSERYAGRVIGVQTLPPNPDERYLGVQLVYEFRLMTPQDNLLNIRLDARTGEFLDVFGRGQLQARKSVGPEIPQRQRR